MLSSATRLIDADRENRTESAAATTTVADVSSAADAAPTPIWFHALAAAFVAVVLLAGWLAPDAYGGLLAEDRIVEWSTVALFVLAGAIGLRQSLLRRRTFAALVALFCLFVAGEEFSWGQRLVGFNSPEFFLAHNFQQEMTLHNLPQAYVRPKWILMSLLAAYGVLLPLLGRSTRARTMMTRVGAVAPPMALLPWFAAAVVFLLWYPFTLTGEWVECLSGALFLAATKPAARTLGGGVAVAALFGLLMTPAVDALEGTRDSSRQPCAAAQVQALVDDIVLGGAAAGSLWQRTEIHKRVWTATVEGYVDGERLQAFRGVRCEGPAAQRLELRQKYVIDPWGSPYWLAVTEIDDLERLVMVYSFGANRRRDNDQALPAAQARDVLASGVLRRASPAPPSSDESR